MFVSRFPQGGRDYWFHLSIWRYSFFFLIPFLLSSQTLPFCFRLVRTKTLATVSPFTNWNRFQMKQKSGRGPGRKDRRNSSDYKSSPFLDPTHCAQSEEGAGVALESQSLPGTPLSHSSAVSRSSDASVSSASSTRALILSHPTQSSTAI